MVKRTIRCNARDPERGSGTVLALGLVTVAVALFAGILALSQAAVMASKAATAADLAALAAADAARGLVAGEPCSVAEGVAARNDARITSCRVLAGDTVEVATEFSQPFALGVAAGRARAGPPP
ncbi:Rv3654c family TadE-like protein [Paenarthrobacter sp. NPDC089714]|uniref:Rv3654c family TadE-like protein n=1 Tax=Paenarthrobacter sp. NPDC089714 TaxID=3364377 RepID=UPI0037F2CFA5